MHQSCRPSFRARSLSPASMSTRKHRSRTSIWRAPSHCSAQRRELINIGGDFAVDMLVEVGGGTAMPCRAKTPRTPPRRPPPPCRRGPRRNRPVWLRDRVRAISHQLSMLPRPATIEAKQKTNLADRSRGDGGVADGSGGCSGAVLSDREHRTTAVKLSKPADAPRYASIPNDFVYIVAESTTAADYFENLFSSYF